MYVTIRGNCNRTVIFLLCSLSLFITCCEGRNSGGLPECKAKRAELYLTVARATNFPRCSPLIDWRFFYTTLALCWKLCCFQIDEAKITVFLCHGESQSEGVAGKWS